MEHKQGVDGETMVDRISDLPDEVSLHILSFLAITDVLHFGRVSKRCGQLHLLTPSLKFDGFSNLLNKNLRLLNKNLRFLYLFTNAGFGQGRYHGSTFR